MSNLISHAKRELQVIGYNLDETEESPNKWMPENLLELINVFSKQGHSGHSASYCVDLFNKLARFEPLSPLTGEDSEWNMIADGEWQNNRCSHVFKDKSGAVYDSKGIIFRDPDGSCWQSNESRVPITFPYTPKTEYVDRKADE